MTIDEVIALGVGLAQFGATLFISIVMYRQTEHLKRLEHTRHTTDAFNFVNKVAVLNDANLIAIDTLGRADVVEDIEVRRKRWCSFIWLEALQETFMALKHNMIDERYAEQALQQQLRIILKDADVYWLVCNRGFDPDFVDYCTDTRARIKLC
jgi:hypothetical protein